MRLEFEFCDGSTAVIEGDDLAGIAICHETTTFSAGVLPAATSQIRVRTAKMSEWEMPNPQVNRSRLDEPSEPVGAAANQPADRAVVKMRPAAYDAASEHDDCEPGKQAVS